GRLDLGGVRIDEQGYADAGLLQLPHRRPDLFQMAQNVQTAFGGQLGPMLGHQADIVRLDAAGDVQHLRGDGAFQIHAGAQNRPHIEDIGVLDVAPVFAQMQGDQVRPGVFCPQGGLDGIGISGETLLAQRCNVVDIDAQFYHSPTASVNPGMVYEGGPACRRLGPCRYRSTQGVLSPVYPCDVAAAGAGAVLATVSAFQPPPSALYSSTRFSSEARPVWI